MGKIILVRFFGNPSALPLYSDIFVLHQDIDALGLRAKNSQYVRLMPFIKIANSVSDENVAVSFFVVVILRSGCTGRVL